MKTAFGIARQLPHTHGKCAEQDPQLGPAPPLKVPVGAVQGHHRTCITEARGSWTKKATPQGSEILQQPLGTQKCLINSMLSWLLVDIETSVYL